jgi:hypothetical protein
MADIAPQPFINYGLSQAQQGQAQSSAALQGQQAQGAAMTNQITAASMPMIMQALDEANSSSSTAAQSGTAPSSRAVSARNRSGVNGQSSSDDDTGTGHGYDGASMETTLRDQNFVPPWTQDEQQQLTQWTKLAGLPGPAGDMAKARVAALQVRRQARMENATAQNQKAMGNMYDTWATASTAPDPLVALASVPDGKAVASQIAMRHGADEDGARAEAKAFLEHGAAVSHLYSGRPTHDVNGQLVDDKTSQNVVGQNQVYRGSTAEQLGEDRKFAVGQVDVPTTSGTPIKMSRLDAPVENGGVRGAHGEKITADQYALQQDQARRKLTSAQQAADPGGAPVQPPPSPSAAPAVPQQPGTATTPAVPASGSTAVGPAGKQAALQAKHAAAQTPPPAEQYGTAPPVGTPEYGQRMQVALANAKPAEYGPKNTQTRVGMPVAGQAEGIKTFQAQQKELREYGSELATSSDQSLQNFNAAKRLLAGDTTLPITGAIGAALQKASAALGILDTNSARVRQEAAKYLVQGAVSGLKETYGSRPGVFDVKINVEKAFPSLEGMGINEVRNLVDSQITQAQYLKDTSQRATQYADRGYEPGNFKTWNARFFPRANIVTPANNGPPTITSQKDYDALKPGDAYVDSQGASHHKGGR